MSREVPISRPPLSSEEVAAFARLSGAAGSSRTVPNVIGRCSCPERSAAISTAPGARGRLDIHRALGDDLGSDGGTSQKGAGEGSIQALHDLLIGSKAFSNSAPRLPLDRARRPDNRYRGRSGRGGDHRSDPRYQSKLNGGQEP
jgi:hypothetical protein